MKKKIVISMWGFRPASAPGLMRFTAPLVCAWTRSEWSHVGMSVGNEYVEADGLRGVVKSDKIPHGAVLLGTWTVEECLPAREWVDRQVGKKYDWPGVLGFFCDQTEAGRKRLGRWFCSEFSVTVARKFGVELCGNMPAWKVGLGNISKELEDDRSSFKE